MQTGTDLASETKQISNIGNSWAWPWTNRKRRRLQKRQEAKRKRQNAKKEQNAKVIRNCDGDFELEYVDRQGDFVLVD